MHISAEALCGLEIRCPVRDPRHPETTTIRQTAATSAQGVALLDVHEDPHRLHRPIRKVDGKWVEIEWDEAFELAAEKLAAITSQHGNNAVGFYIGNPSVHNIGTLLHVGPLARVLKTKSAFSATSVDQLPQQLRAVMFGPPVSDTIPTSTAPTTPDLGGIPSPRTAA